MIPYGTAVDATLTQAERAAPFLETPPDDEPLPLVTRCPILCDGLAVVEVDEVTGQPVRRAPNVAEAATP